MSECVKVGEKVILRIQTKNQMEKLLKRKIFNHLSVVEKVMLKMYMRKRKKAIVKKKILEYVSVGERVELIKINEEVKGWTSSSKQQKYPPEITKTKEETRLERTKRNLKYQP